MEFPRPKLARTLIAASLLSLSLATPGIAGVTQLIGVEEVTFAWQEATGSPDAYLVSVSHDRGPSTNYALVFEPRVRIPVAPNDRIAIEVQALRYRPDGGVETSPSSGLSDEVWVSAAPGFPMEGEWTLDCAACPAVQIRSLADASEILVEAAASSAPWRLVGRGTLDEHGSDALIWYNPVQGQVSLRSSDELALVPGGSGWVGTQLRYVGAVDADGQGAEEIAFFDPATGWVEFFALTPGGIDWIGGVAAPPGKQPVAMGDFTGDGIPDFVWRQPGSERVELQATIGSVRGGTARSVPLAGLFSLGAVAAVPDTGDFDGDGDLDLVLRLTAGGLAIVYLDRGLLTRAATIPAVDGDENRIVVGSADVDGDGAEEIALQDATTHRISILFPQSELVPLRAPVLTPGLGWWVVDVR